jgi:hypothetical protein
MNTQALVELITDAVTDAVREALPKMVAAQLDARMASLVMPSLEKVDQHVFQMQAHVQARIVDMQADFAKRGIDQCDALTSSWNRRVEALRESIADQVAQAVAAVPSHPGPAGPPGPPGEVRALVAVHWQPGTTYRAGAVLMHRNGLWFANADSSAEPGSGVDGYTLMFDGQELDGFETDDTGALVAVLRYASGRVTRKPTGLRQLAYLGVYDHETTYHTNDVVTASGSMWICKAADTLGLRPGTDNAARAWQLAVKCGRDGRDGAPGPRGEPGAPGAAAAPARAAKPKVNGAAP